MKANELEAAVATLFDCVDGEPRAWTRNPPRPMPLDDATVPDEERNWYAVFGYGCNAPCSEEELVNALWKDLQVMHVMCTSERPTLIWRRKPEYSEGIFDRKRYHKLSIRIVIPELAHGSMRSEWLKVPSYTREGERFKLPLRSE